ncbi:MAG TPA: VOC family protein [Xanthobacteraceae bacterium]
MISSHGRFVWYELATIDTEAAKAFYADVVGWGTQDASVPGASYTLFTAGGAPVSGLIPLPEQAIKMGLRPSWLGYVGVDDVDAAAERIRHLGGVVHVPPQDVPNISRVSVAVDPQMATIGLLKWLHSAEQQPADPDAPGRVGWHELLAVDWQKVWGFYSDLFGWQKTAAESGDSYQPFSTGGETLGGMLSKPPMVPGPFWLYYFNIGDIDLAVRRVKAGRGRVVNGPIEVPGNRWIVQCTDPLGAIFALSGKRSHDGIGYFERVGRARREDPAPAPGERKAQTNDG